jgi:hypothetical protein
LTQTQPEIPRKVAKLVRSTGIHEAVILME